MIFVNYTSCTVELFFLFLLRYCPLQCLQCSEQESYLLVGKKDPIIQFVIFRLYFRVALLHGAIFSCNLQCNIFSCNLQCNIFKNKYCKLQWHVRRGCNRRCLRLVNNNSAIMNCQRIHPEILILGYSAIWLANLVSIARQVADGDVSRRCNLSRSIAKSRSRFNFPRNLLCNFLLHCKLQARVLDDATLPCNLQRKPLHCKLQEKIAPCNMALIITLRCKVQSAAW